MFGFAGTPNNINIWDRSPVYSSASMLDGRHDKFDFAFEIYDQRFDHLYYLVDGIYPALSWFLSTNNDPTTTLDSFFLPSRMVGGRQ